jgi:predicted enzyme related to lactoylglutathione lyase
MNCLTNLDVDDLEEAVRFYSSVFGLQVGRGARFPGTRRSLGVCTAAF